MGLPEITEQNLQYIKKTKPQANSPSVAGSNISTTTSILSKFQQRIANYKQNTSDVNLDNRVSASELNDMNQSKNYKFDFLRS